MSAVYRKPLPDIHGQLMAPFWQAARARRLVAQRCSECSELRWPPLPLCDKCLAVGGVWVDIKMAGTIWSFAIYHRAFGAGFTDDVPYVVAVIETDDGLQLVGNVKGPMDCIAIGARVLPVFEDVTDEVTLVHWSVSLGC
jgi:uncharacterized OB-fold protein